MFFQNESILFAAMVLVFWTMIIWAWMYMVRLPAIKSAKMKLDPSLPRGQQMSMLPPQVRWKADNYNNLMEQPTVFYAAAIIAFIIGEGEGINAILAWIYVALRIGHSLVQALINKIELRFLFFFASGLVLFALTINILRIFFL